LGHPRDGAQCGLNQSTVSRIWRAFSLQPHRSETFKLSTDPLFIEKVRDIIGLYLNPPDQALDRSQPPLPVRPGQVERHTHDYVLWNHVAVRGARHPKRPGDRPTPSPASSDPVPVPADLDVHLIVDNYATHKTALIQQ
jgi:hypothetical protein